MGYTHYWRNPKGFTDKQWTKLKTAAETLLIGNPLIGNFHGTPGSSPVITDDCIGFNGIDGCETCYIEKQPVEFGFCKTRQLPYDEIVVEFLKLVKRIQPKIKLSSDGDEEGYKIFG